MKRYQLIDTRTGEALLETDTNPLRSLQRWQAVDRRANRRDFDLRYGNSYVHPSGVVRPAPSATARKSTRPTHKARRPTRRAYKRSTTARQSKQTAHLLGLAATALFVFI